MSRTAEPGRATGKAFCAAVVLLSLALTLGHLTSCKPPSAPPSDRLHVAVSILPQQYFLQRIGGDRLSVSVTVPPGADPATYEPRPEQLRALSHSAAYFRVQVPFEDAWMQRIASANPAMRLVDTTKGIDRMAMDGGVDPHIWLSPRLVKVQAKTIAAALMELDPASAPAYQANLERFVADVDALDAEIRQTLSGLKKRTFLVFHPSWGYFARDYGLTMIAIEVQGQEPSAAEMAAVISRAKAEGIRVVFAQPQFSTRAAHAIAREIGGEVVLIDPLAPDWLEHMRRVAETVASALNSGAGS